MCDCECDHDWLDATCDAAEQAGKLEAEVERLRDALKFYADEANWQDQGSHVGDPYTSGCLSDYGERARKALAS